MMLLRQISGDGNQTAAVLQPLRDQEASYKVQISAALRQRNEAAKQYERATGAQKEAAGSRLTEIESRIAITEGRLSTVRERIAEVQREVVISTMGNHSSTAVSEAPPRSGTSGISATEFGGGLALLFVFPIILGLSRWIWRRTVPRPMPENVLEGNPQFARLEQAVEAIAIEVERISEAQRFSAKLLAERPVEPVSERAAGPRRAMRPVVTPLP